VLFGIHLAVEYHRFHLVVTIILQPEDLVFLTLSDNENRFLDLPASVFKVCYNFIRGSALDWDKEFVISAAAKYCTGNFLGRGR
jgi:hypothetical protein